MSFKLNKVIPWGRSYAEYIQMFDMTDSDLDLRILGCADGPASFNSVLTGKGGSVTSIDPVYQFSNDQIRAQIEATSGRVFRQLKENFSAFKWGHFQSPEILLEMRLSAMNTFLRDFDDGVEQGIFFKELPILSFSDGAFDLALCSHFLFLYSEHLSEEFHLASIFELLRVANELRIFPIIELNNQHSRHLERVLEELETAGFEHSIKTVDYEFQYGGNQMLSIRHKS